MIIVSLTPEQEIRNKIVKIRNAFQSIMLTLQNAMEDLDYLAKSLTDILNELNKLKQQPKPKEE